MKKSELLARIVALEARIAALETARPLTTPLTTPFVPNWPPGPLFGAPQPFEPPYTITCVTAQPLFGASH